MNQYGKEFPDPPQPIHTAISDQEDGSRLDIFLSRRVFPEAPQLSGKSRRFWQQRIEADEVKVNGKAASKGLILKQGMNIEISFYGEQGRKDRSHRRASAPVSSALSPADSSADSSAVSPADSPADSPVHSPLKSPSHFPEQSRSGALLEVLYEDDWIIGVDKPAGLPCHPLKNAVSGRGESILEMLAVEYPEILPSTNDSDSGKADQEEPDPLAEREGFLLHRLDNWTSGVLLFAKNREAFRIFRDLIRGSGGGDPVHKEYVAAVTGRISGPLPLSISYPIAHSSKRSSGKMLALTQEDPENGQWTAVRTGPRRSTRNPKFRGTPRAARTEIISSSPTPDGSSICRIRISRGQRHQIRCHLAAAGYPILGDTLYGGAPLTNREGFLLHHQKIEFFHTFLKRCIRIEAPVRDWVRRARFSPY